MNCFPIPKKPRQTWAVVLGQLQFRRSPNPNPPGHRWARKHRDITGVPNPKKKHLRETFGRLGNPFPR